MSYQDDKESANYYRHFKFTWLIRDIYAGGVLLRDEICTEPLKMREGQRTTWSLGISETADFQAYNFFLTMIDLEKPTERVYLKLKVSVTTGDLGFRSKINHYGWCVHEKPFLIPIKISKSDLVSLIETSTNWYTRPIPWKIRLEVAYNGEEYDPEVRADKSTPESYKYTKQVAVDLFHFAMNPKFSDLTVRYKSLKAPVHRAIIEARCPKFFHKYCNMFGEVILSKKYSSDCFFFFLLFAYSGNIDFLIDSGILPFGLHEFAKGMEDKDLASLTEPIDIHYRSKFEKQIIQLRFRIRTATLIGPHPYHENTMNVVAYKNVVIYARMNKTALSKAGKQYIGFQVRIREGNDDLSMVVQASVRDSSGMQVRKMRSLFRLTPGASVGFPRYDKVSFFRDNHVHFSSRNGFIEFLVDIYVGKNEIETKTRLLKLGKRFQRTKHVNVYQDIDSSFTNILIYTKLAKNFETMLTQMKFPDLTLKCGEYERAAHRVMLSARSSWFSERIDKLEDSILVMQDTTETDLNEILYEIYTGNLEITPQNVLHLYEISLKFNLASLKSRCVSDIEKTLTIENCIQPLDLAISFKDYSFKKFIDQCASEVCRIRHLPWFQTLLEERSPAALSLLEAWRVSNLDV